MNAYFSSSFAKVTKKKNVFSASMSREINGEIYVWNGKLDLHTVKLTSLLRHWTIPSAGALHRVKQGYDEVWIQLERSLELRVGSAVYCIYTSNTE